MVTQSPVLQHDSMQAPCLVSALAMLLWPWCIIIVCNLDVRSKCSQRTLFSPMNVCADNVDFACVPSHACMRFHHTLTLALISVACVKHFNAIYSSAQCTTVNASCCQTKGFACFALAGVRA